MQQWKTDDHLSLVANITRLQTTRLNDDGIHTLRALASATPEQRPAKIATETFDKLRRQARLQDEQRIAMAAGEEYPYRYEFLETGIEPGRGFFRLPLPSAGDVFFDMEGDPYYDIGTGLEYLFGVTTPDGQFRAFWGCDRSPAPGHDRLAEKRAFEAFVDFVFERRAADPDMHSYHYASYEKTALLKPSQRHATREEEVAVIPRGRLVDLYGVVARRSWSGNPATPSRRSKSSRQTRRRCGDQAGDDRSCASSGRRCDGIRCAATHRPRGPRALQPLRLQSTLALRDWLLQLHDRAAQRSASRSPYAGKEPRSQA